MSGETPKKVSSAEGDCFLCKDKIPSLKEKVKIFGKSELQIGALIHRALGVDLGVYVGSENLAICRLCYNMLNAYNKALKKVNQIVDGIKQKFESNRPLHIKRLSKDSTKAPEARKSLSLDSNPSGEISRDHHCVSAFTKLPPVFGFGAISPMAPLSIFRAPNCVQSSGIVGPMQLCLMSSSTPKTPRKISERSITETKVYLSVEYPSRTVRKELNDDLAVLGKAIASGFEQRIAKAILKNVKLKKIVVEKVLQLMTSQINGICSRKQPSMLRANTKEEIVNFDFEKLCLEWKERAPIFYAFLMTCATTTRKEIAPEWLPSIAVAGSILLKQRNSHMNGCATVLGILIKSRSLEVREVIDYFASTRAFESRVKTNLINCLILIKSAVKVFHIVLFHTDICQLHIRFCLNQGLRKVNSLFYGYQCDEGSWHCYS